MEQELCKTGIEGKRLLNLNSKDQLKEDVFYLLSELSKSPDATQRQLSSKLNISLGKTNYLLRKLIKKGLIKVKNFSHRPGKIKKIKYILTPEGFKEKIRLTYHFLKRAEAEYNYLKQEWERLRTYKEYEEVEGNFD
ncbi:MAG: MarR family EPS-associated transcriptional regulator [Candidatus Aenigmatarchaeota archaeon]|nr:MAG: MarR family EPS-associated transcriptional regulator [Candidatus Aenigmarchaeota archaeon]